MRSSIFLVMALAACARELPLSKAGREGEIFVPMKAYAIETNANSRLLTVYSALSLSALRKSIVLIKTPTTEVLDAESMARKIPITVTKSSTDNYFAIKAKKPFESATYGVYLTKGRLRQSRLAYTFFVKPGPPKVIHHNMNANRIDSKRTHFTFTFDQKIILTDDAAISLISSDSSKAAIKINRLELTGDHQSVVVTRSSEKPLEVGSYAFVFNSGVQNHYGSTTSEPPIPFTVDHVDSFYAPVGVMSASDDRVAFRWQSAHRQRTQLFLTHEATSGCNQKPCGIIIKDTLDTSANNSIADITIGGLKSRTTYSFWMRAENSRGEVFLGQGAITTAAPTGLRFSEFMINPKSKAGQSEVAAEYLELKNVGDRDEDLRDLRLRIEDVQNGKASECLLEASHFVIKPQQYFLIVSDSFVRSSYAFSRDSAFVRLKEKTLCGGLSNNRRKIITLHRGDGNFIDRYGGFYWQAKNGQSVQRIELKGLDEPANYCYSNSLLEPSPGAMNAPC